MDIDGTQFYGSAASEESVTESELREIHRILESSNPDPQFGNPDSMPQNLENIDTQTSQLPDYNLPATQQGQQSSGNPASTMYYSDIKFGHNYIDNNRIEGHNENKPCLPDIEVEESLSCGHETPQSSMSKTDNLGRTQTLNPYDGDISSNLQIPDTSCGYVSPQYEGSRRHSVCSDVSSVAETLNPYLSPHAFPPRSGSSLSQRSDVSALSSFVYPDFQAGIQSGNTSDNVSSSSFDYNNFNSGYLNFSDGQQNNGNMNDAGNSVAPSVVSGDDFLKFLLPDASNERSNGFTRENEVPQVTISPAMDDFDSTISADSGSPAPPIYQQSSYNQDQNITLQVPNTQGYSFVSSPQYTSSGLSDTESSSPYSPGAKSDDSVNRSQMDKNCQVLNFLPNSEQDFLETKKKRGRPTKRSSSTPGNFNRYGYNESPQVGKEKNSDVSSSKARRHSAFLSIEEDDSSSKSSKSRSRSGSGSANSGGKARSRSRSHSSREYFLELATGNKHSRPVRTHPANYECPLCESRFTRAYNLQSHLRTHANERPFSCRNCGKSFSRAHDRKRHENLHTGERKYRCFGYLADNVTQWGCGRSFARADALSRHFRSEQGKLCIRALFDEERRERLEKERRDRGDDGGGAPDIQISDVYGDDHTASINEEIYRHLLESITPFSGSDAEGGSSVSASGQDEPSPSLRSEGSWT